VTPPPAVTRARRLVGLVLVLAALTVAALVLDATNLL